MFRNNRRFLTVIIIRPYMSSKAGFVSLAHFRTDWISLTNPVSLGFSKPRSRRFFITATNSRLLSWPSTEMKIKYCNITLLKYNYCNINFRQKLIKATVCELTITVYYKYRNKKMRAPMDS